MLLKYLDSPLVMLALAAEFYQQHHEYTCLFILGVCQYVFIAYLMMLSRARSWDDYVK
jgi:hypothetical protein